MSAMATSFSSLYKSVRKCLYFYTMLNLTSHQLREAADLKEKIAALEQQLGDLLGQNQPASAPVTSPAAVEAAAPAKRTMSPAHKAKIRAAQKLRWAKYGAAKTKTVAETTQPGKRGPKPGGMSAEGKARIIAAQKLRWQKYNAAKPAAEPVKKRKMSAAGRARIIAAVKARWAKVKAAKK